MNCILCSSYPMYLNTEKPYSAMFVNVKWKDCQFDETISKESIYSEFIKFIVDEIISKELKNYEIKDDVIKKLNKLPMWGKDKEADIYTFEYDVFTKYDFITAYKDFENMTFGINYVNSNIFYMNYYFDNKDRVPKLRWREIKGLSPNKDISDTIILIKSPILENAKKLGLLSIVNGLYKNDIESKAEAVLLYLFGIEAYKSNKAKELIDKAINNEIMYSILVTKEYKKKRKFFNPKRSILPHVEKSYFEVIPLDNSYMFDYIIKIVELPKEFIDFIYKYIDFIMNPNLKNIKDFIRLYNVKEKCEKC